MKQFSKTQIRLAILQVILLLVSSFAVAHPEPPENRPKGSDNKFNSADKNSDGLISKEEFRISHQKRMEKHFARLDLNNDNHLSKDEMKKTFKRMAPKLRRDFRTDEEKSEK